MIRELMRRAVIVESTPENDPLCPGHDGWRCQVFVVTDVILRGVNIRLRNPDDSRTGWTALTPGISRRIRTGRLKGSAWRCPNRSSHD